MKHATFTTLLLAVLSASALQTPANALSCMNPSAVRDFNRAHASVDTYVVVNGTLTFDEAQLPPPVAYSSVQITPRQTSITATLAGFQLGFGGFEQSYEGNVELQLTCAGPWCGTARSGLHYLAFIKVDNSLPQITIGPCGGQLHANPSDALLEQMRQCLAGGKCEETASR